MMKHDTAIEVQSIVKKVWDELDRATFKFGPMASAHEGYAVILEELDELWDLVKEKHYNYRFEDMEKEAVQVAAMAIRFVMDVCR